MNRLIKSRLLYVGLATALILPFQNCSKPFHASNVTSVDGTGGSAGASPEASRFAKANAVIQAKCTGCHTAGGQAAFAPLNFSSESQFVSAGFISPGEPAASKLVFRLRNYPDTSVTNRNMPTTGSLTEDEYASIYAWVSQMSTGQGPFSCNTNQSLADRSVAKEMRRLSRRQYINTLNDLFGRALSASAAQSLVNTAIGATSLPADDNSVFSRFDAGVIRQHIKSYFDISDNLATAAVADPNYTPIVTAFVNLDRGACTALNVNSLSQECVTRFIANFGRRALRRPLLPAEATSFMASYTAAGGARAGIGAAVFRMLMAPHFLYQIEDAGVSVGSGMYRLSSHALISRLSYMFWNSMPDEALFTRAAASDMSGDADFIGALDYAADHAKGADATREFMNEWLKLRLTPNFSASNVGLQYIANGMTLDASLRQAMIDEVEELGSYAVANRLTFSDLFLTDVSFARDSRLMSLYGVTQAAPANVTPATAVRFPAGQRGGLLSRAALLISGSEIANPVKRGYRVRKELLCLNIESPPANLPDALSPPEPNSDMTTRQRYDLKTGATACNNCHQYMNTLGHALGAYNSLGRYGLSEPTFNADGTYSGKNLTIDTRVDLSTSISPGLSAQTASEFSNLIAAQNSTQQCFAQKFYRFSTGRPEDLTKEGCRLNQMYSHLKRAHSLKDFMKSMAADAEFRHRKLVN